MLFKVRPPFIGVVEASLSSMLVWDVRTTDLWVHQLNSSGGVVQSWNILSDPTIPTIPAGAQIRVDVRFRNYGATHVSVRVVMQTIGRVTGSQGQVIYSPFSGDLAPNTENVQSMFAPMWGEPIYQRLWFDNEYAQSGNCPAGAPPPWGINTCRQGEVFDYALSSRHLTAINLTSGPSTYNIGGVVVIQGTQTPISGAVVTLSDGRGGLTTGADGIFSFTVIPSTYSLHVSASGYNDGQIVNIVVPPSHGSLVVELSGTGPCQPQSCPQGQHWDSNLCACVPDTCVPQQCQTGYHWDSVLCQCVPDTCTPQSCPAGFHWDANQCACVQDTCTPQNCPSGQHWDPTLCQCVNDTCPPQNCQTGYHWDPVHCQCIPNATKGIDPLLVGEIGFVGILGVGIAAYANRKNKPRKKRRKR